MSKEIKLIGEVDFKDVKVKVYNDPYTNSDTVQCVWRMRNPNSCYEGIMFMNWETGKMSYPEGAIIPEQTDEDREILPQFMITGKPEIDDEFLSYANYYLEKDYKRRNKNKDE